MPAQPSISLSRSASFTSKQSATVVIAGAVGLTRTRAKDQISIATVNATSSTFIMRNRVADRGAAGGIGGIGVTVASQNLVEPKPVSSLTLTERTGCPVDCGTTDFRR